ncbi:MAG TPA: phosphonoacetaldehyde reductase [Gemmatimonadaceae bacterium]|nr:phosphonoacetaldehyde reductase [Gemmatimonadaceae bacterium]
MFYNPVRIHFGSADLSELPGLIGSRSATLITTPGMVTRGVVEGVKRACAPRTIRIFSVVKSNPTIASITAAAQSILDSAPDLLIAMGGGSTLDTAKGVAAIASPGCSHGNWLSSHLRERTPFPEDFSPLPVIAFPTTAGTGSEVTMWGTVWDEANEFKYSISHPRLFPEAALLVPELTLTAPSELTLFSALDTISHCMEAIWNRRASPVSDVFAVTGLTKSFSTLDRLLDNLTDIDGRRTLQEAALLGGLAISSNATAVAHSISYPLTSRFGMPHGLACSFTLPEIIRFNGEQAPERVQLISDTLGAAGTDDAARRLELLFSCWEVPAYVRRYVTRESAAALKDRLLTPGRADNNIRAVTADDALGILNRSLH